MSVTLSQTESKKKGVNGKSEEEANRMGEAGVDEIEEYTLVAPPGLDFTPFPAEK